jgi:hypothetical protein
MPAPPRPAVPSLCETCRFLREVLTPKGSRFLLCRRSETDAAFPKYPPQPVVQCRGYENRSSFSRTHAAHG